MTYTDKSGTECFTATDREVYEAVLSLNAQHRTTNNTQIARATGLSQTMAGQITLQLSRRGYLRDAGRGQVFGGHWRPTDQPAPPPDLADEDAAFYRTAVISAHEEAARQALAEYTQHTSAAAELRAQPEPVSALAKVPDVVRPEILAEYHGEVIAQLLDDAQVLLQFRDVGGAAAWAEATSMAGQVSFASPVRSLTEPVRLWLDRR